MEAFSSFFATSSASRGGTHSFCAPVTATSATATRTRILPIAPMLAYALRKQTISCFELEQQREYKQLQFLPTIQLFVSCFCVFFIQSSQIYIYVFECVCVFPTYIAAKQRHKAAQAALPSDPSTKGKCPHYTYVRMLLIGALESPFAS